MPDAISTIGGFLNALGVGANDPTQLINQDPNGQPYNNPKFFTRLFNPNLASYVGQQNASYTEAPRLSAQREQISQDLFTKNIWANSPEMRNTYAGPDEAYAAQKVPPSSINQEANAKDFFSLGGPAAQAQNTFGSLQAMMKARPALNEQEIASAQYQKQLSDNLKQTEVIKGLLGTPGASALGQDALTRNVPAIAQNELNRNLSNIPAEQQLSLGQTRSAQANLPYLAQGSLAQAQREAALQGQNLSNVPYDVTSLRNQSMLGAANSWTGPTPPLFGTQLSLGANGQPSTRLGMTPGVIPSELQKYNAMTTGSGMLGGGANVGASLPNGQPLPMKTNGMNPLTGRPDATVVTRPPITPSVGTQTNAPVSSNTESVKDQVDKQVKERLTALAQKQTSGQQLNGQEFEQLSKDLASLGSKALPVVQAMGGQFAAAFRKAQDSFTDEERKRNPIWSKAIAPLLMTPVAYPFVPTTE